VSTDIDTKAKENLGEDDFEPVSDVNKNQLPI
jgi:hypothetical protein